ncbi:Poly-beta-1,6-N-acetyl-D-glucosamine N-deacetylase [Moorella thermoacetica]
MVDLKSGKLLSNLCLFAVLVSIVFIAAGCRLTPTEEAASFASRNLHGEGLVVLCYHRVLSSPLLRLGRFLWPSEEELTRYTLSTGEFAAQLDYLRRRGVRFVTPGEAEDYLTGKKSFSGKLALVTFDDGDLSVYREAFPILKERHIPFLLFLVTGQVGKRWQGFTMCTWEQIREMVQSGLCTVGLHTHDLHYLDRETKKPVFLLPGREADFAADTARGVAILRDEIGAQVRYFAYPYGFGNPSTDRSLASEGIPNVFTLRAKVNRPGDSRSFIGRVLVTPESWPQVAAWADGNL